MTADTEATPKGGPAKKRVVVICVVVAIIGVIAFVVIPRISTAAHSLRWKKLTAERANGTIPHRRGP